MRILIAIDGSPHTAVTLRLGAQIAHRAVQPPTILTVLKRDADRPQSLANETLACARRLLDIPDARTKIRIGHPAEEIVREATEGNYELVVVGKRQRRNPLTRLLLGSTAVRVAERAACPVIVAQGKAGPIQRILLCDSGSPGPPAPGRFTARLTDLLRGEPEVTVLHVMSQISAGPGVRGAQLRAGAEELIKEHTPEGQLLEQDIQILERTNIHPRPKVRHGLVVDEILTEARVGDYDLVVVGAYRGAGWQHILLDDLAHKIVTQLDRPVLIVR